MKTPIDRIFYFSNHVSMDERDTPFTTTIIEQVMGHHSQTATGVASMERTGIVSHHF
jgi:hypothetical protein